MMFYIPSQQELQTGWRGRYRGQRCSPPSARSTCTETQTHHCQHLPFKSWDATPHCLLDYLCVFGERVQSDQIDLQRALLLHGQGEGQVAERIERHRDFGAHGTHQGGLEKAVEDVHNDGVISFNVVLPRLLRYHLAQHTEHKCVAPPEYLYSV